MNQQIERKIKEQHEYVRHIFQLFIGWFTFFATVNYATMGWLAKPSAPSSTAGGLIILVSVLFISQNALGIAGCFLVRHHLRRCDSDIQHLEQLIVTPTPDSAPDFLLGSTVPMKLYSWTIVLVAVALTIILAAWCAIPMIPERTAPNHAMELTPGRRTIQFSHD